MRIDDVHHTFFTCDRYNTQERTQERVFRGGQGNPRKCSGTDLTRKYYRTNALQSKHDWDQEAAYRENVLRKRRKQKMISVSYTHLDVYKRQI